MYILPIYTQGYFQVTNSLLLYQLPIGWVTITQTSSAFYHIQLGKDL